MEILIRLAGVQLGPYSEEQVRQHLSDGLLSLTDSAKLPGMEDWAPLGDLLSKGPSADDTKPLNPQSEDQPVAEGPRRAPTAPPGVTHLPSRQPEPEKEPAAASEIGQSGRTKPIGPSAPVSLTPATQGAGSTVTTSPLVPANQSTKKVARAALVKALAQQTSPLPTKAVVLPPRPPSSKIPPVSDAPAETPAPTPESAPAPESKQPEPRRAPPMPGANDLTAKTVPMRSAAASAPSRATMPVTSPLPTRPVFPPASGKVVAPPVVSALTKKLEKPVPPAEPKKDAPPPVDLEEEIATVKIPAPIKEKEEKPVEKPTEKPAGKPKEKPVEKSAEKPADKPAKPASTAPPEGTPEPKAPRRTFPILIYACASVALLMLYYVWSPYHAASVLRNALNNGDVSDLNSATDFPSVRQTLKQQIHDQVAQANLQGASSDSVSSALAMIDHSIDFYVTPEEISALIKTPDSVTPGDQGPTISPAVAANLLLAFNSHGQPARSQGLASIGDFVLDWDVAFLHLRFQVLGWKLNRVDLRPDLPVQGASDTAVPLLSPVVDTYLESGNAKLKESKWDGAIADFTQVLAIDPQSSVAYNDRATARQSKNDLDGAIKDYSQAIAIDPQMAAAYNGRGNAKATKNDADGAIADFTQAIQLDPTMAVAYDSRGNLKAAAKDDLEGAIADFSQAITLDPNMASAYSDRGFARQANNNLDGAIADYTQALALKPKTAMSYYNRGLARQAQGNLDAAIVDFDRALAFDPKIAGAYYNRGNAKNANHDIDGAIADFTQALALNPKIAPAYSNRGAARQSKGDLDGALSDYTQALNLDPKISSAYYNRAVIEAQKDDLDSAIADTTQALYLDPKNAQAYDIRGFSKLAKGNLDGALADLKQSNDLAPKDNVRLYLWLISKAQNSKVDADQELSDALENSWNSRPDELVSKTAAFFLGRMNETDYLAAADSPDPKIDQSQHCQVWYFAGMKRLLSGDKKGAIDAFHECIATGQKDSFEYLLAQTELQVLDFVPAAPAAAPATPPVAQPAVPAVKGP